MSPRDWRDDAACRYSDPEAWFPDSGVHEPATRICMDRCPIREACLEHAMTHEGSADQRGRWGIFGGLNATQRYRLYLDRVNARKRAERAARRKERAA